MLTAEAVSILATRSVHALPGELSVTSAIAKAYVPTTVQDTLGRLAEVLGVRGFLTTPPGGGFAKLERDHRICAIFDGSTVVNRTALLTQTPRLGRLLRRGSADTRGVRAAADPSSRRPRSTRPASPSSRPPDAASYRACPRPSRRSARKATHD
ncbi:acyl-CoA dehydrogenase family protein [Streptomyces nogalater]